jgi:predicted AAA+ superfamily ATPase
MVVYRRAYFNKICQAFEVHSVVALLGPRQSGKTTLAKEYLKSLKGQKVLYFDLEDARDLQALQTPLIAFGKASCLVIIDEIQRLPDLFPTLRVLVDQNDINYQFLILGSASRDLIHQSSETLAGRIEYIEVHPFDIKEVDGNTKLHLRGGFPKAFLASTQAQAFQWLESYVRTFLERDIPALGFSSIPAQTLRRFWTMLAHYHGNILNHSELARSLGVSDHTIRHYLDILCGTFMVRQLLPWFENTYKRQVKRPKVYIRDSGIFHQLLSIDSAESLLRHPKAGASWEGYAMEQVIRAYQVPSESCYFWAVHEQGELDLFLLHKGKRLGFEFKFSDAPSLTSSMKQAVEVLKLDELTVIYPGPKTYKLSEKIQVRPLYSFLCDNDGFSSPL